jgi:hypothetical protein
MKEYKLLDAKALIEGKNNPLGNKALEVLNEDAANGWRALHIIQFGNYVQLLLERDV